MNLVAFASDSGVTLPSRRNIGLRFSKVWTSISSSTPAKRLRNSGSWSLPGVSRMSAMAASSARQNARTVSELALA